MRNWVCIFVPSTFVSSFSPLVNPTTPGISLEKHLRKSRMWFLQSKRSLKWPCLKICLIINGALIPRNRQLVFPLFVTGVRRKKFQESSFFFPKPLNLVLRLFLSWPLQKPKQIHDPPYSSKLISFLSISNNIGETTGKTSQVEFNINHSNLISFHTFGHLHNTGSTASQFETSGIYRTNL